MKTDILFLNRLHRQDHDAFRQLFEAYFMRLYDLAASLVFDADMAEDIVQGVFLGLYENPARLRHGDNIGGWLFIAVRNACYMYLRKQKVEDSRNLLYLQALERSDTLDMLDGGELVAAVMAVIADLPDKCREICEMRFFRNMKFGEIAAELSISENTARVQVFRALEKIRRNAWTDSALSLAVLFLITAL